MATGSNSFAAPLSGGNSGASSSAFGTTGLGFGSSSSTDGGSSAAATGTNSASLVGNWSPGSPFGAASSAVAASAGLFWSSPSSAVSAGLLGTFGAASSGTSSSAPPPPAETPPSPPDPATTPVPSSSSLPAEEVWHTDDELMEHIANLEKSNPEHKLVVVFFHGVWTKFSQMFVGHFRGLVVHYGNNLCGLPVKFMRVKIHEEFKYLHRDYGLRSYPTVHLFSRGGSVEKITLEEMTTVDVDVKSVNLKAFTKAVHDRIRQYVA